MKKRKETIYQYEATFDPNGVGYTVTVANLPGLVTEGNSMREAREMTKDAIRCYLGALLKDKMPRSKNISVSKKATIAVTF